MLWELSTVPHSLTTSSGTIKGLACRSLVLNASPDFAAILLSLWGSTLVRPSPKTVETHVTSHTTENQYRKINHSPVRLQQSVCQDSELCWTSFSTLTSSSLFTWWPWNPLGLGLCLLTCNIYLFKTCWIKAEGWKLHYRSQEKTGRCAGSKEKH